METQAKTTAKDFFINLGAVIALYASVVNLVNLLFRVINHAYPQINESYGYGFWGSQSISWPVAALIIFFPIFILLMWLLERDYRVFPEKQYMGIHKWLAYITLFVFGLVLAGDLIAVLYYFIDGQELTAGFLLKVLALLVIAGGIFSYYLLDVQGKLTGNTRKVYRIIALIIVLGSIVWGFAVLGSPRTQQLLKRDQEKISQLQNIDSAITSYYLDKNSLPETIEELMSSNYAPYTKATGEEAEYSKTGKYSYNLCATFNRESTNEINPYYPGDKTWKHPAGYYCFSETINPDTYSKIY